MSIYISGLDMPKEGDKTFTVYPDGTVTEPNWQWDTKLIVGAKAQQIGPHGRLIDADALVGDLLFDVDLCEKALYELVGQKRQVVQDEKDTKQNCAYWIKDATTIIEAERGGT